jgi:hypothetical protein
VIIGKTPVFVHLPPIRDRIQSRDRQGTVLPVRVCAPSWWRSPPPEVTLMRTSAASFGFVQGIRSLCKWNEKPARYPAAPPDA